MDTNNLGFELIGGIDDPQFPNDSSIIISHVSKGSAAEGKLKSVLSDYLTFLFSCFFFFFCLIYFCFSTSDML